MALNKLFAVFHQKSQFDNARPALVRKLSFVCVCTQLSIDLLQGNSVLGMGTR